MESAFEGHLHCHKSSEINDAYFHMDTSHAATETFQTASKTLICKLEDDLARAHQPKLLAGDFLDVPRIAAQTLCLAD
jgi:endonuclease/exonuclease/phosphatase (EEP) superfamily protein YafD